MPQTRSVPRERGRGREGGREGGSHHQDKVDGIKKIKKKRVGRAGGREGRKEGTIITDLHQLLAFLLQAGQALLLLLEGCLGLPHDGPPIGKLLVEPVNILCSAGGREGGREGRREKGKEGGREG